MSGADGAAEGAGQEGEGAAGGDGDAATEQRHGEEQRDQSHHDLSVSSPKSRV